MIAFLLAADTAAAARIDLQVRGGERARTQVCGRTVQATVATQNEPLRATARLRGAVLSLRVARCGAAKPRRIARGKRPRLRLPTSAAGGYRIRAYARQPRTGRLLARRSAWLRVSPKVTSTPISFTVQNVNRSRLACSSDGREHTVAGRLVAPADTPRAVTLYLHEYGWGRFFWQWPRRDLNYARALAEAGHASVVVDRLGYDESSHPDGNGTCLGSQADVAHQIVEQLKARFDRVALAGHSAGGAIAELSAASFGDTDALVLFAYADQGFSTGSIQEANEQGLTCTTGGEPADEGGPAGYAYFAQTPEEWRRFMFASADPVVQEAAAARRNRDPCGDATSLTPAAVTNYSNLAAIDVPVLLLYGTSDAVYDQPAAGEQQRGAFSGSDDVTLRFLDGAGHALTLERSAPELRGTVSGWLAQRGF